MAIDFPKIDFPKIKASKHQSSVRHRSRATQAVEFFNVLTSPELLETTEALLPEHRERLYPPTVALSMFMRQVLEADGSCQKAVNCWAAERAADGLCPCSVRTVKLVDGTGISMPDTPENHALYPQPST